MSTPKKENLQAMIERFLHEKNGSGLLSIPGVARLHFHLVDSGLPLLHIGYVRFLKSCGVSEPKPDDLCEFWLGEYHEFLHQNFGELLTEEALASLEAFWSWAFENQYVREKVPLMLESRDEVPLSFRVKLSVEDNIPPKRS